MTKLSPSQTKQIKALIAKTKALETVIRETLCNNAVESHARYFGYKSFAQRYNMLAQEAVGLVDVAGVCTFDVDSMRGPGDIVWPQQKALIESILLETKMLLATLEGGIGYATDETNGLADFIQAHLRDVVFEKPESEKEIQNALETLLIGRGLVKGTDYDRESGKVEYSGKEYIPDFCMRKLGLAIEVKLLKEGRKQSQIIEQISADITAYGKEYYRQLFVVYDIGCIQNVVQFRRDIEQSGDIQVVVVKH